MQSKDSMNTYEHRGKIWRLGTDDTGQTLILLPEASLTLPGFGGCAFSELLEGGRAIQTCINPDGWMLRIEVYLEQGVQGFALSLGKADFKIRYQDVPPALCLDLLESFADLVDP